MIIGIYKIISPSKKIYIGESIDIDKRWKRYHRMDCKGQPKLFNSFNKYGIKNHKFEIIEECEINNLRERERYWQEYYSSVDKGNNCKYTNTKLKKAVFSESIRNKMSKNNTVKKVVYQFSLEGEFIKEWESPTKASHKLNICKGSIYKTCLNKRKQAGGFRWVYKKDYISNYKFKELKSKKIREVIKLDLNDNIIKEYPSIISTEKDGFDSRSVSAVCNNKYKTHLGFKWKFK